MINKILNYTLFVFILLFPPLWVIIYETYNTWIVYSKQGYNVPRFIKFLYEYNFEITYYRKLK